uniref:Uncharacterized protein n=1 Tax=Knipowitschia caucasica TaxID=637954 RepID=A0AAV2IU24_KNICA
MLLAPDPERGALGVCPEAEIRSRGEKRTPRAPVTITRPRIEHRTHAVLPALYKAALCSRCPLTAQRGEPADATQGPSAQMRLRVETGFSLRSAARPLMTLVPSHAQAQQGPAMQPEEEERAVVDYFF